MLARALGPSLNSAGISDPIPDPGLELHDADGALIASNDNWKDTDKEAIEATGLAPQNDLESALLVTLPAGLYTTVMRGIDDSTGVGLVEVYRLK